MFDSPYYIFQIEPFVDFINLYLVAVARYRMICRVLVTVTRYFDILSLFPYMFVYWVFITSLLGFAVYGIDQEDYLQCFNVCPFDCIADEGSGKIGLANR